MVASLKKKIKFLFSPNNQKVRKPINKNNNTFQYPQESNSWRACPHPTVESRTACYCCRYYCYWHHRDPCETWRHRSSWPCRADQLLRCSRTTTSWAARELSWLGHIWLAMNCNKPTRPLCYLASCRSKTDRPSDRWVESFWAIEWHDCWYWPVWSTTTRSRPKMPRPSRSWREDEWCQRWTTYSCAWEKAPETRSLWFRCSRGTFCCWFFLLVLIVIRIFPNVL